MKNELVPVEFQEVATLCAATEVLIGGRTVIGVADARDLHSGLGVGRDFTNWIKGRITKYDFREGVDYEICQSPNLATGEFGHTGGTPSSLYRLTLHMAKELAMVENNDRGRLIRRYYIWLEETEQEGGGPLSARTVGGIMKGVVNKRIEPLETAVVETARQVQELARRVNDLMLISDTRGAVARDLVSVRQLLDDAGALPKGRNAVNRKIGNALRGRALNGCVGGCRKDLHSGVWLFPIDFAHEFMESTGNGWVRSHNARIAGQGEFTFEDRRKAPRRRRAGNDDLSLDRVAEIIEHRAQAIAREHRGMDDDALTSALQLQQARMRKELHGITDQEAETFVRRVIDRVIELLKAA